MKTSPQLIWESRVACAVFDGPFTPVVFEPYEHIGGERGVRIAYATETKDGRECIVWRSIADREPRLAGVGT